MQEEDCILARCKSDKKFQGPDHSLQCGMMKRHGVFVCMNSVAMIKQEKGSYFNSVCANC